MSVKSLYGLVVLALTLYLARARAVPIFAYQTGQPCTACHIGAFGLELTRLGRMFKINGYTMAGNSAPVIPLAVFVQGGYTNTTRARALQHPSITVATETSPLIR